MIGLKLFCFAVEISSSARSDMGEGMYGYQEKLKLNILRATAAALMGGTFLILCHWGGESHEVRGEAGSGSFLLTAETIKNSHILQLMT